MRRMYSEKQIDSQIKEVIECGQVDNAKPIYCHPLTITNNDRNARLTCLIFNNDPTPFTLSSFVDYIDALFEQVGATVRIMTSGCYALGETFDTIVVASYFAKRTGQYFFSGQKADGTGYGEMVFGSKEYLVAYFSEFSDGVNKIN